MKKSLKLTMMTLGVVAGGLLTSCSTENDPSYGSDKGLLVKAPKVVAYSGDHYWGATSTRGVDVNGNLWYQKWERPTNVTQEEIEKVLAAVADPRPNVKNDIHIDWNNYWVQQVYTGQQTYEDGYGQNIGTGSSHMNHLLAYSDKVKEQTAWWPEEEFVLRDKRDYEDVYEHVNNFNSGQNNTVYRDDETGEEFIGTTLMTDMYCPEDVIDQFGYHNSTDSKNHYEYIIIEVDGNYYICFDFFAEHPAGQDANKNMDVERDWVFNDWIVKISPAYLKGQAPEVTEPETPETPDPDPNEGDDDVLDPSAPSYGFDNEVEINLGVDDKNGEYLESHLSIHVRANTDVEVFIPVPAMYYCDADDMAVVEKHFDELMLHGGPEQVVYNIAGNEVTFNVQFVEGGIRIWTDGINEEVINYCRERYDDGITFEVWNYFNDVLSLEELKSYLDKATVRFLDREPDYYINAFGEENYAEDKDCTVDIVSDQVGDYNAPVEGEHLNGSIHNKIYEKK